MVRGLGEVGRVDEKVEDSEVSSVRTSDLSSDYEPSDDSDEESESDVDTGSCSGILSNNSASAAYTGNHTGSL